MFGRFILSFAVAVGAMSSANVQLIPAGSVDIGTVTTAGSSVQTADGWAVSGSGSDIWVSLNIHGGEV